MTPTAPQPAYVLDGVDVREPAPAPQTAQRADRLVTVPRGTHGTALPDRPDIR